MALLDSVGGFDFRILSIIGIYVTLLLKPLQKNFIENIHKTLLEEDEQSHQDLIYQAEQIIKKRKSGIGKSKNEKRLISIGGCCNIILMMITTRLSGFVQLPAYHRFA